MQLRAIRSAACITMPVSDDGRTTVTIDVAAPGAYRTPIADEAEGDASHRDDEAVPSQNLAPWISTMRGAIRQIRVDCRRQLRAAAARQVVRLQAASASVSAKPSSRSIHC
jgi:hypothetical protein